MRKSEAKVFLASFRVVEPVNARTTLGKGGGIAVRMAALLACLFLGGFLGFLIPDPPGTLGGDRDGGVTDRFVGLLRLCGSPVTVCAERASS